MKKVISLLLALVMTLSLCSGVWAEDISQGNDQGGNQQESGPAWPKGAIHLEFCENGMYYNGKGVDPGASVTFDALYVDGQHDTAITGFSVSDGTSAELNAVATKDGKLTVTVADNCEPGDKFVVLMVGETKYALRLNVNEVGGNQGGGPKWPTTERFCFEGTDNDGRTSFFNGTGIDQGRTVTFEKVFKDNEGHMQITSFAVDEGLTSKGLTATANGEALTVTITKDCELGEKFVVIVADNIKYSMCFNVREAGGNQGGGDHGDDDRPTTGNVTDPEQLNSDAQEFIKVYIDYSYGPTPSGAKVSKLTIKGPDGKGATDKDNWYTDPAAREAVIAAYNAFCNIGPSVQSELNKLFVMDDNGNPCTFYSYMLGMRQLADNGSGSYTDTNALNERLRGAGYVAPVLGRDLLLSFPTELRRGEDYDYTYDQSSGHLTITVKKGSAERWLDAAESSFAPGMILANVTFLNLGKKSFQASWSGNQDDNTWDPFITGQMQLAENSSNYRNGDALATINKEDNRISVISTSYNGGNRIVVVWANQGEEFAQMTKYLFTYEIKAEEGFRYERTVDNVIGKVDMSRVITDTLPEAWTTDATEAGVLKIWRGEGAGDNSGTIKVKAPDGYTLRVDECSVTNGNAKLNNNQNGADECVIQLDGERNTFLLTWANQACEKKQETLDVFFLQNILDTLGRFDVDQNNNLVNRTGTALPVTKPTQVTKPTNAQTSVGYNLKEGFFYTSFDRTGDLPSYEQLQEGVLLTPDGVSGATHFRQVDQSTGDMPKQELTDMQNLILGFYRMSEDKTYAIDDQANDRLRTLPYVDTDYQEIGGIQVSYAADQGYRYKIVQWLHKEDNGTYTVLGYSYVWGRNGAFINEIQTSGVAAGSEAASEEPFVIGEGMQLRCDRYPQYGGDGKIQYFQFRAYGDHEGDYILYIPYEYFGMDPADGLALRDRGQRPRINHYYEDHTLRETIVGEYTEYGVKFTTESFSPFVVDCSTQTTPPRYYYNSTTAAAGKQEGGNSPTTFDAGIALYVGMALTSAAGMAWVGKKRR